MIPPICSVVCCIGNEQRLQVPKLQMIRVCSLSNLSFPERASSAQWYNIRYVLLHKGSSLIAIWLCRFISPSVTLPRNCLLRITKVILTNEKGLIIYPAEKFSCALNVVLNVLTNGNEMEVEYILFLVVLWTSCLYNSYHDLLEAFEFHNY